MEKTKKTWFGVLLPIFVVVVLGFSFYRFYIQKDFITYDFVPCDTNENKCFLSECGEDDPRCQPFIEEDGLYAFSVLETYGGSSTIHYCTEENIERFNAFVFDAACSD